MDDGLATKLSERGRIYGGYIAREKPDARIAVLYQNDDYGKDYLKGLRDGLGEKAASMIVAEDAYEVSEPTIDTHIVKMKTINADVLFDFAGPKFAAQAIKKAAEIGWKPMHFLKASALRLARSCSRPVSKTRKALYLSPISWTL